MFVLVDTVAEIQNYLILTTFSDQYYGILVINIQRKTPIQYFTQGMSDMYSSLCHSDSAKIMKEAQ